MNTVKISYTRNITDAVVNHCREMAQKRHDNAKGTGVQIRIEPEVAKRLNKTFAKRIDRRTFASKAIMDALDHLLGK